MREALLNFLKACWEHLSITSFGVGAGAGWFAQPLYDLVIGLLGE
jgi:hypothetical protein